MPRRDWKAVVRDSLHRVGLDIRKYPPVVATSHAERRAKVFSRHGVDVVLDVGANIGQYAAEIRRHGFGGQIISFEPLAAAFTELLENARDDSHWRVENLALGSAPGTISMHVSRNLVSSSALDMRDRHVSAAPSSIYVSNESVAVKRLDDLLPTLVSETARVALKVDVQGFEREVLAGAVVAMKRTQVVELEMSLVELYANETLMPEMTQTLVGQGFELVGLEPGLVEPASGHLLQVDGLFVKRETDTRANQS